MMQTNSGKYRNTLNYGVDLYYTACVQCELLLDPSVDKKPHYRLFFFILNPFSVEKGCFTL